MSTTKIIAIAGGSCSGKTTIANKLQQTLGTNRCELIYQDNYYRGLSTITNFDVPEAIDFELMADHLHQLKTGKTIPMPTYDFAIHRRKKEVCMVQAKKIIIVDGILILHTEELRNAFDFKVFVECSEDLRKQRRLIRDTQERGREEEDILRQFSSQVAPLHNKYVEPSKQYADLVFPKSHTINTESGCYKELFDYCLA